MFYSDFLELLTLNYKNINNFPYFSKLYNIIEEYLVKMDNLHLMKFLENNKIHLDEKFWKKKYKYEKEAKKYDIFYSKCKKFVLKDGKIYKKLSWKHKYYIQFNNFGFTKPFYIDNETYNLFNMNSKITNRVELSDITIEYIKDNKLRDGKFINLNENLKQWLNIDRELAYFWEFPKLSYHHIKELEYWNEFKDKEIYYIKKLT